MIGRTAGTLFISVLFYCVPGRAETEPEQAFRNLSGLFYGREYVVVQTTTHESPIETNTTDTARMHICSSGDAVVVRCHSEMKVGPQKQAEGFSDGSRDAEYRWFRDECSWETRLYCPEQFEWPAAPERLPNTHAMKVVRNDISDEASWGPGTMVIADLASSLDRTGMTFADMCAPSGPWGFSEQEAGQPTNDEPLPKAATSEHVFHSSEYGQLKVTLQLIRDAWYPVRFSVIRNAEHKMVPDGVFSFLNGKNLVGNYRTFSQFTHADATLDSMEIHFVLAYDDTTDRIFPASIQRDDIWYSREETASMHTALDVVEVLPKEVTRDDVRNFAMHIPDGTPAVVAYAPTRNIKWTISDGEVVKKINYETVSEGDSATFTSNGFTRSVITFNVIAVGMIVVTLWGYRRFRG